MRVEEPVAVARNLAKRSRKAARTSGSAATTARSSCGSVGLISRQPSRSSTTSAEISSRLMPAMMTSRTSGAQAATKRARSGPTRNPGAAGELEVLRDAAVEIEAGVEIIGIGRLDGVAELVKALFVERGRGEIGLAPVARRDVRPLGANLELAVVRQQLCIIARHGQADMAGAAGERIDRHEERRGFGGAEAGQHRYAIALRLHGEFVEAVPDEGRQRRTREEHRVQPAEEFFARSA